MAKFIQIFAIVVAAASANSEINFLAKDNLELASGQPTISDNMTPATKSNTESKSSPKKSTPEKKNTPAKKPEPVIAEKKPLWTKMHIIGAILMTILITLSNAGGLSGAGSNIPIMLIFFNMGMAEAVPISAFVAVCATVFRFCLNYNQKHPNKEVEERTTIDYQVVSCTMPAVFFGSLIGVESGPIIGQTNQMIVFGITVAWSIYTTSQKACELIKKEKAAEDKANGVVVGSSNETPLIEEKAEVAQSPKGETQEEDKAALALIYNNEKKHFTAARMGMYFFNFVCLLVTQTIVKDESNPMWQRLTTLGVYMVLMGFMTSLAVSEIDHHSAVKGRSAYIADANDMKFEKVSDIVKLALCCMCAAILCGMTGIAGGMVLGPLFLKYNMLPVVMSSTNQYITMVASISVAIQFAAKGAMNWDWALTFGIIALISAFIGIQGVKKLMEKSGKQSIITIILTFVLVLALVSLPIKSILLANAAAAAKK